MAKLLLPIQILGVLSSAVSPSPIVPVVNSSPVVSTTSSSAITYVPTEKILFTQFKQILDGVVDQKIGASSGYFKKYILDAISTEAPSIDHLLSAAPFTNIASIYKAVVEAQLTPALVQKFQTPSDTTQNDAQIFMQNINDTFAATTPDANDIFTLATTSTDLTDFIQALKDANIPLSEDDPTTLIKQVTTDLLDTVNNSSSSHEINTFQTNLNAKFANTDAFLNAIVRDIINNKVEQDKLTQSITDQIDQIYRTYDQNVADFGLAKMQHTFEEVQVVITANETDTATGIPSFVGTLKAALNNSSTTLTQAKDAVDAYKTAKDGFVLNQENNVIKKKADDLISSVQTDWKAILASLPTNPSYWDALQAQAVLEPSNGGKKDPFAAFKFLLGNDTVKQNALKTFILNYGGVATDVSKNVPQYFDITGFVITQDITKPQGQRTRVNFTTILSTKVRDNNDAKKGYVPNFSDSSVKNVYLNIFENYISVTVDDLQNIITNDFVLNSNPSLADRDPWATSSKVSDLDLYELYNGTKWDASGNPITNPAIDPNNYTPSIYKFDNTTNLELLFPRLHWIIRGNDTDAANVIDSPYSFAFKDTLFASPSTSPVIEILNRPIVSTINPPQSTQKFMNYDLQLKITDGNNSSTIATSNVIQANNVSVYDKDVDEIFATSLNKYLKKASVESDSYVGIIIGGIWDWKNLNTIAEHKPGDYSFTHLYELLNLLYSNDPKGSIIPVVVLTEDEKKLPQDQQDNLIKDRTIKQLIAISQIVYTDSTDQVPLKVLFNLYSAEELVNQLNVSGVIHLIHSPDGVGWETSVEFTTNSSRVKDDLTSIPSFAVSVHSLKEEIERAKKQVSSTLDQFRPLVDLLVAKGDITNDQVVTLNTAVQKIVDDFNAYATEDQINTLDQLNGIRDTHIENIEKQLSLWFGTNSKNASSQLSDPISQKASALANLKASSQYRVLTPDQQKDVDRYIALQDKVAASVISQVPLSNVENNELNALQTKMDNWNLNSLLSPVFLPSGIIARITTTIQAAGALSAGIYNNKTLSNEIKDLGQNQIAEYLAKADLSDPHQWQDLVSFINNPLAMQQIKLTKPMKAVIIGLGSFMGLVGLGTTFSTLRSFKTNKNISKIGDDASINYEKPKKTMAIKIVISASALAAASAIITLVFTLGGGI